MRVSSRAKCCGEPHPNVLAEELDSTDVDGGDPNVLAEDLDSTDVDAYDAVGDVS